MSLIAEPGDAPAPTGEQTALSAAVIVSLVLHALASLLLIGGVDWQMSAPGSTPIDVELVVVPEAETPEAEQSVPDEEPVAPLPPPPARPETEPDPEPEPAPSPEIADTQDEPEPPVPVVQAVDEFAENPTAPAPEETQENRPPEPADVAEAPEEAAYPDTPAETSTDEVRPEDQPTETEADADVPSADEETREETETPETAEKDLLETDEAVDDTGENEEPGAAETQLEAAEGPDTNVLTPEASDTGEADAGTEADANVGEADDLAPQDFGVVGPLVTAARPVAKPPARRSSPRQVDPPAGSPASGGAASLPPVARILTGDVLPDARMRAALASLPPGQRLNLLCMTELRQQLNANTPPYLPDLMPSLRPRGGTVLDPGGWVAFRSFGQWFDVAFRCETDEGIRRVERFSFRVGAPIPRSQWGARRLPVN